MNRTLWSATNHISYENQRRLLMGLRLLLTPCVFTSRTEVTEAELRQKLFARARKALGPDLEALAQFGQIVLSERSGVGRVISLPFDGEAERFAELRAEAFRLAKARAEQLTTDRRLKPKQAHKLRECCRIVDAVLQKHERARRWNVELSGLMWARYHAPKFYSANRDSAPTHRPVPEMEFKSP